MLLQKDHKFHPSETLAPMPRIPSEFLQVREELARLRANPNHELIEALADAIDALETVSTYHRHSAMFKICGIGETISDCVAVLQKYPQVET